MRKEDFAEGLFSLKVDRVGQLKRVIDFEISVNKLPDLQYLGLNRINVKIDLPSDWNAESEAKYLNTYLPLVINSTLENNLGF